MDLGILYHGTTRGYHDRQLRLLGRYEHVRAPVSLDASPSTAVAYALQRAAQYEDSPLLLITSGELIRMHLPFIVSPLPECAYLEREWYAELDIGKAMPRLPDLYRRSFREPEARQELDDMLFRLYARIWSLGEPFADI
jgi:hypothetical protein